LSPETDGPKSDHLLKDLLFDDAGHRMIATQVTKAGVRYRYYASRPSLHGEAGTAKLGSVSRVPALEIEQAIISALQNYITAQTSPAFDRRDPIKFDHAPRPGARNIFLPDVSALGPPVWNPTARVGSFTTAAPISGSDGGLGTHPWATAPRFKHEAIARSRVVLRACPVSFEQPHCGAIERAQLRTHHFLFAAASFLICSMIGPRSFSAAASSALSCSGGQRRSVCWMAWNIWRVSGNGAQP
jgi:hypothetical protein